MSDVLVIKNAIPYSDGRFSGPSDVFIKNGRFTSVSPSGKAAVPYGAEEIDACGKLLVPGYIDIHTHGAMGEDVMNATFDALEKIGAFHLSKGVTSYCPTTMTAAIPDIKKALENIKKFTVSPKNKYARICGAHLEGPYLSPKAAGAHPLSVLKNPDKRNTAFIKKYADFVSRITVAPDLPGAPFLAGLCSELKIQVSLGHDGSIDDEIYLMTDKGASSVTHLYNCTSRPSRRTTPKKHLGLTEIGLIDERLTSEVIADNRHVPDALFKLILKVKGADKIALVSDSLSVAGMPEGDYLLGAGSSAQTIRVEDGVAVLPSENTYAGSITSVGEMAARLCSIGIPKEACIKMAAETPAKLLGLTDRGSIKAGMLADFNLVDSNLNVEQTFINAVKVF